MLTANSDLNTLYCRFIDTVINHRRLEHLDQFLDAEVIEHMPREAVVGLDVARQALAAWLAAFPDLHLLIEDLVVDGDHLMARLRASGTPRAPLGGQPSGTRLSMPVFEAWSVRDGRCVERWLHVDHSACEPRQWFGCALCGRHAGESVVG